MVNCNPVSTPLDPNVKLVLPEEDDPRILNKKGQRDYLSGIGKLTCEVNDLDEASYKNGGAEEIKKGNNLAEHTRDTRSSASKPSSNRSPQRTSGNAVCDPVQP
ncbi:hypothetical protein EV361DRAFT_956961 [Lentinula raphanica]|nr:hypothetical protein EV361DRAFT_956961 [Lentinula raphanica]